MLDLSEPGHFYSWCCTVREAVVSLTAVQPRNIITTLLGIFTLQGRLALTHLFHLESKD